jgi:hypothetical protein
MIYGQPDRFGRGRRANGMNQMGQNVFQSLLNQHEISAAGCYLKVDKKRYYFPNSPIPLYLRSSRIVGEAARCGRLPPFFCFLKHKVGAPLLLK